MHKIISIRKVFIAVVAVVVVGGSVFYACKKDGNASLTNPKSVASTGMLENPFKQYGIWHNACLDYMFAHLYDGTDPLSADALWLNYGVPYFQSVLGANYVEVSLDALHAGYAKSYNDVVNKQYLTVLQEMVDAGGINPDYTSTHIGRNNYQILEDYFTFLTNFTVTTEDGYWIAHNKLCAIEQEILANYYSLLNAGVISDDTVVKMEYEGMLGYTATAISSSTYWGRPDNCGAYLDWYYQKKSAELDAMGYWNQYATEAFFAEISGRCPDENNCLQTATNYSMNVRM